MENPYIQSVTIHIPSYMVLDRPGYIRDLFKAQHWGNYFKYGYSSLIMLDLRNFYPTNPLFNQIAPFFNFLQGMGILSPYLSVHHTTIHEIKLRFDITIHGAIFCKTGAFLKINDSTYRSNDTRQFMRKTHPHDNNHYSKGRQMSFINVIQHEKGSSVIFSFSGKYRRHIPFNCLMLDNADLIHRLCAIGSVYLTRASNPESFIIARGYRGLLPQAFQEMLNNANWNEEKYKKKNIISPF